MHNDNHDPPFSLCPYCQSKVDNEVTECPDCGGLFPALRHRRGEPMWGAICGAVRGFFLIGFFATLFAIWKLLVPPLTFEEPCIVIWCVAITAFLFWLGGRCHERAYHVRL